MSTPTAGTLWNVPYQRNPLFTGREEVLGQLHQGLQEENAVALSHPQGISGLGGIGKTQMAIEYAYRYGREYDAVLWVRAGSSAVLTSSFGELAHVLHLPERNESDQHIIIEAVQRWFRQHTGWLLIFDGVDDLSVAEPFLPKAGPGHIVFTTRAQALGAIAQRLEVQKMEPETGALLLLRRSSLLLLQATLDLANSDDTHLASQISQELDGLPLALDQAGAYINEMSCPLADYLSLYQQRRRHLLRTRGTPDGDYPASVATTWSLSFEKVRQANPASVELLKACALLAPEAIPEELFTAGSSHLGKVLAPVASDPLQFDQACKDALRFSLIAREADGQTLTMHRLVQAVLQDGMDKPGKKQWAERMVMALDAAFPFPEHQNWPQCDRLVPHAKVGAGLINASGMLFSEAARLLNHTGLYLLERARYQEAELLLERALAIDEQVYGSDHLEVAADLNNLAAFYSSQGKHAEAELLHQRALSLREQILGADHLDTANSLNNLAEIYKRQGRYPEAEPLYQRAISIREHQLGADHPSTATSLNNLAALYQDWGRYTQAESLYQRALAIREQRLGVAHHLTANSLNNLAVLYKNQGRYLEAEPLYQQAISIHEQLLGADHPDTATGLNNLAMFYESQGRYPEAEPLCQRALAIREQRLGADHPDTATSLNNLAVLYYKQGKYMQAEPLLERALSVQEQRLGADHPLTASSLNNLATLYQEQGKYAQAEPLLEQALAISEQQLGVAHSDTALHLNNLATLYFNQGKYTQAEPLLKQALAIREQQLGVAHPLTASSFNNLATLYQEQGKYTQAEPLLKQALAISEHALGQNHPDTQAARKNYAILLQTMKRDAP